MRLDLFTYFFMCPFNLLYVLDLPVYHPDLQQKLLNNDGTLYETQWDDLYSLHNEQYLYTVAEVYYSIILRRSEELKKFGLIENENQWTPELKLRQMKKDKNDSNTIILLYENRKKKRNEMRTKIAIPDHVLEKTETTLAREFIQIKIKKQNKNGINNWHNYKHIIHNGCIHKLNKEEYKKLANAVNHSPQMIISSYCVFFVVTLVSFTFYIQKSIYMIFPTLIKCDLFFTHILATAPLILYIYFYFYFNIIYILSALFLCILLMMLINWYYSEQHKIFYPRNTSFIINEKRIYTFLINYRVIVMNIVYILIFAVDFFHFPKHFAKSRYIGNTLMDIGVGSCLFSSAFTSSRIRNEKIKIQEMKKDKTKEKTTKGKMYKGKSNFYIKQFILLFLGLARYFLVELFKYNVNITEYGYHWNFFLTLCCTFVAVDIITKYLKTNLNIFLFSCLSIITYEVLIHYLDIHQYILKEQRSNIFSMNKEGLFNLLGSINLYLLTISLRNYLMAELVNFDEEETRNCKSQQVKEKEKKEEIKEKEEKEEKKGKIEKKDKIEQIEQIEQVENLENVKNNTKNGNLNTKENNNIETEMKEKGNDNKNGNGNGNGYDNRNGNGKDSGKVKVKVKQRKKTKGEPKKMIEVIQKKTINDVPENIPFFKKLKKNYFCLYFSLRLFFFSFLFYAFHLCLNSFKLYSVRILSNANYIFIVLSINLYGVGMCYIMECTSFKMTNSPIFLKLNKYNLFVFLYCNIFVGLFNILFQPMMFSLALTILILFMYSAVFLLFAHFLSILRF